MIRQERLLRVIEYLHDNKTATFAELAKLNGVSTDTVRRDCIDMEEKGMLRRVRGGAAFLSNPLTEQQINGASQANIYQEREVLSLIGEFVAEGQAIALNNGAVNVEIARYLAENYDRLTVLTNDLNVVHMLVLAKGITLIVPSGILDPFENAIFGSRCELEIAKYNVDIAFLSVYAFSSEKGITDYRASQIGVIKAMQSISQKTAVTVNDCNYEKVAYMNTCDIQDIHIILSNRKIASKLRSQNTLKEISIFSPV